jgi:MIT (microtubule interacting and transport) domain
MANTNNLEVPETVLIATLKADHAVQRAIELVKLAIIEDEKHNYADAYKVYQNALDYFMLAFKCKPSLTI